MRKLLKKGDRIRLKTRLGSGWKGCGTVTMDMVHDDDIVQFRRDGDPDNGLFDHCLASRHEVAAIRRAQHY